jgi:rhamnosyltransferase
MTSGNLLSVAAWEAMGGFDEGLFIDQVDHDLCLRMHRGGFEVLRCRDAHLHHRLGTTVKHRFPVTNYATHHSSLRRYYITRNRLEMVRRFGKEFPEFRKREMSAQWRELGKIVLYEDRKVEKLKMAWRGYRDYRRGVSGRYSR